jgi:hypothetical protein
MYFCCVGQNNYDFKYERPTCQLSIQHQVHMKKRGALFRLLENETIHYLMVTLYMVLVDKDSFTIQPTIICEHNGSRRATCHTERKLYLRGPIDTAVARIPPFFTIDEMSFSYFLVYFSYMRKFSTCSPISF